MILHAGFDLTQLAQPLIRSHGRNRNKLVLIQATRTLELIGVGMVTKHFSGTLLPPMNQILDLLEPDYTKFFAIAHSSHRGSGGIPDLQIMDESDVLRGLAAAKGFHLIGHVLFEEDRWQSLCGNHYFDEYLRGFETLPPTMDHWSRSMEGIDEP